MALALAAACGRSSSVVVDAPAPVPHVPTHPAEALRRPPPDVVRYGPSALRYVVSRRLRIDQAFGGQSQTQDLAARAFVSVAVTGPADAAGYPATFTVDSIVPDSSTPRPVAEALTKVRGLVFAGRLAARGDFQSYATSDTVGAQTIAQLVGNFRDFLPRIPADGVKLGAAWTDTATVTQRGNGGTVTRHSTGHSQAVGWEDRAGTRSLRIEASATYSLTGSGQNGGQPFQVNGTGTSTARSYVAEDGRFLGGESRDSTTLTVSLPAQGLAIPVTQVLQSSVTVRP